MLIYIDINGYVSALGARIDTNIGVVFTSGPWGRSISVNDVLTLSDCGNGIYRDSYGRYFIETDYSYIGRGAGGASVSTRGNAVTRVGNTQFSYMGNKVVKIDSAELHYSGEKLSGINGVSISYMGDKVVGIGGTRLSYRGERVVSVGNISISYMGDRVLKISDKYL